MNWLCPRASRPLIAACAVTLVLSASAAWAVPKEGEGCVSITKTIDGKQVPCKRCTKAVCDTKGSEITNCRNEITTTCEVDAGRSSSPVKVRPPAGTYTPPKRLH